MHKIRRQEIKKLKLNTALQHNRDLRIIQKDLPPEINPCVVSYLVWGNLQKYQLILGTG